MLSKVSKYYNDGDCIFGVCENLGIYHWADCGHCVCDDCLTLAKNHHDGRCPYCLKSIRLVSIKPLYCQSEISEFIVSKEELFKGSDSTNSHLVQIYKLAQQYQPDCDNPKIIKNWLMSHYIQALRTDTQVDKTVIEKYRTNPVYAPLIRSMYLDGKQRDDEVIKAMNNLICVVADAGSTIIDSSDNFHHQRIQMSITSKINPQNLSQMLNTCLKFDCLEHWYYLAKSLYNALSSYSDDLLLEVNRLHLSDDSLIFNIEILKIQVLHLIITKISKYFNLNNLFKTYIQDLPDDIYIFIGDNISCSKLSDNFYFLFEAMSNYACEYLCLGGDIKDIGLSEFEMFNTHQRKFSVKGTDRERDAWYLIHVTKSTLWKFNECLKDEIIHLENHGTIYASGYGDEAPEKTISKFVELCENLQE